MSVFAICLRLLIRGSLVQVQQEELLKSSTVDIANSTLFNLENSEPTNTAKASSLPIGSIPFPPVLKPKGGQQWQAIAKDCILW